MAECTSLSGGVCPYLVWADAHTVPPVGRCAVAGGGDSVVPHIANVDQSQAWNGYEGEHWARSHDRWDAVNKGA